MTKKNIQCKCCEPQMQEVKPILCKCGHTAIRHNKNCHGDLRGSCDCSKFKPSQPDIKEKIEDIITDFLISVCEDREIPHGEDCICSLGDYTKIEKRLLKLLHQERVRVLEEVEEYVENDLALLNIKHGGSYMKGEWISREDLLFKLKEKGGI